MHDANGTPISTPKFRLAAELADFDHKAPTRTRR
jgi:hypothetical protein